MSPLCTYELSFVIVRVTLQEVKPRPVARAVNAAITAEITNLKIIFVLLLIIVVSLKFAAKVLLFFDICKRERHFFAFFFHFMTFL